MRWSRQIISLRFPTRHGTLEQVSHHFEHLRPLVILFVCDRFYFRLKVKWNNMVRILNANNCDNLICIMKREIRTKHRKFEVAVGKEDKKRKVFLHFHAS